MRITTIAATAGGGLLTAAVLALTLTTPPDPSTSSAQTLQAASSTTPYAYPNAVTAPSATATPRPAPTPLSDDQQALVDDYLAAHPGRADALAATAARWKAFADANPELAAELAKVAAMAAADRKGELTAWFADHPDQKATFEQWGKQTHDERLQRREDRRDRRQDRRDRRRERRDDRQGGSSTTSNPSATGSSLVPSA
jgi:hypothetical protein